ncbi:hypothetical protein MKX01_004654 [Papaver californicum]|nr:hypothetical protein MKX01_004654 [Papaver californicum]
MTRGVLEVLLVDTCKLRDTDFIGKMDPYVVIQFGNQKNEKFTFDVKYPNNSKDEHHQYKLSSMIMDKDTFNRDDFIGESTISVRDVLSLGVANGTSDIRTSKLRVVLHNKTYYGEIRIAVSFTRKYLKYYQGGQ